jgi:simple sugar transport system substrate-binding protein
MFVMKRIQRLFAVCAAVAVTALMLTACGAITPANDSSDDTEFELADYIQKRVDDGEPLRIKLSYHDPSLAFATPIEAGMKKAGEELGADVSLIGPTGGDAAKQVSELQTLIQQQAVDGLAVSSASSDALKPVISQAFKAGIPVISFNTDNPDSDQMGFVGQDLKASGESEAKEMLKTLGDKPEGKVVVFSIDTGAGWSHDRFNGFKEALSDTDLEISGPVNVGNEPSEAYNTVESTMSGQKDVVAIAGLDCCSTTAAAKWISQTDNAGKISMVGFDLLSTTANYIKDGVVTFTISQNPDKQGYEAVKVLTDYLKNDKPIKEKDTGAQIITKKNLDEATVED